MPIGLSYPHHCGFFHGTNGESLCASFRSGSARAVEALLRAGADPGLTNAQRLTPMQKAEEYSRSAVAKGARVVRPKAWGGGWISYSGNLSTRVFERACSGSGRATLHLPQRDANHPGLT